MGVKGRAGEREATLGLECPEPTWHHFCFLCPGPTAKMYPIFKPSSSDTTQNVYYVEIAYVHHGWSTSIIHLKRQGKGNTEFLNN